MGLLGVVPVMVPSLLRRKGQTQVLMAITLVLIGRCTLCMVEVISSILPADLWKATTLSGNGESQCGRGFRIWGSENVLWCGQGSGPPWFNRDLSFWATGAGDEYRMVSIHQCQKVLVSYEELGMMVLMKHGVEMVKPYVSCFSYYVYGTGDI